MAMQRIRLPGGAWLFDLERPLGAPGGFGEVFGGQDEQGAPIAVKRLHIDAEEAAHRELRIAEELAGRELSHVIPVLDSGQDAESDRYFVVMPKADESLQDHLDAHGPMPEQAVVNTLIEIVTGLQEVRDIVHRDLKPANILRYNGQWCVADFGIARFVEDSTSVKTLKDCLSPHYAAPEQWRSDHATAATDVYAVGCIAHALLTGGPPFQGSTAELKDSHLYGNPPEAVGASAQMRVLLAMMLRKSPDARPSFNRIKDVLQKIDLVQPAQGNEPALSEIAAAAAAHERKQAQEDAERARTQAAILERNALAAEAHSVLVGVFDSLVDQLSASVPTADVRRTDESITIDVATATLELDLSRTTQVLGRDAFPRSRWDVVCGAAIEARQAEPIHKRAASLWYTRQAATTGNYRWFEVGYEGNPLTRQGFEFEPAAMTPELADRAHSNAMDVVQTSYPAVPIDDEDADSFCRFWIHVLGEATQKRLRQLPGNMPRSL